MNSSGETWRSRSGIPIKSVYGSYDIPNSIRKSVLTQPGQAPFLRGAYPSMYRSKPWRIFQLSGFGSPQEEGERIRFLLEHGETGFIMEHDRNTGDHLYNVDHPEVMARREDVGLTGAVIQSVRDYETVLDRIPIESTYGHPGGGVVQHGPFALACYWTVAKRRGLDLGKLPGTGQSDFFLSAHGCITKQQVPTQTGLRFNADIIEFCVDHLPHWVPVSIAGYNGADTGLNAYQELAAVLANAVEYLDEIKRRGNVSLIEAARGVGGVSFRVGMDLFEDVAKLRAGRKMWSELLVKRYGITDEKAQRLRIHSLTAGSMMMYPQPLNNIVRGTIMALAGVLGGTQSLGVSGYDEALSIPSEHAHQMSLRIQQILQNETNLCAVADPLGGSYYVESLTAQLEERAWEFFDEIESQNGFLNTLDTGWLHNIAHENQRAEHESIDKKDRTIVGLNDFTEDATPYEVDGFKTSPGEWRHALDRLEAVKSQRSSRIASERLRALETACKTDENIMPLMMDAMDAEVTMGEVGDVFRSVFGDWQKPISI